jgi:hypothetical protein
MKTIFSLIVLLVISGSMLAQTTDTSLVAYYPFNGNAIDLSGYGNNGSLINGVTFDNDRWNNPNQAIRFNKSLSQYVDVQNSPSLQIDSAISFSFWAKRNTLDNGQDQVLNKGGDWQSGTCNYGLVFSEWTLLFIYDGGFYIVNAPGIPLDNEWHHYAVTALEGTTEIHFYVDGVEKTSMLGAGNPVINLYSQSTSDLYLSGVLYYSNNSMDELKIYKRILSEIEIKSLYSNLVAYLPFNGNTIDVSGNGHDGTINGNATLVADRFNSLDRAYTFPDQTSNISLANTTNINLETGFTLNSWVKYKNTYSVIIGKHVCGYVNGFVLGIDYDGQFQLWLGNSGWQTVRTSETLVEDRWYMLTATYDGNSGAAKIYIDGQLENSANISYTNFSPYPISIGEVFQNNCSAANMSGAVDEVKIFNRVLSDAEILEEYNSSNTDLIAYYPFNENVNDESGNNINPTYVGTGVSLTSDRFGLNNRACYFDGNDGSYIRVPADSFPTTGRTISFWVNAMDLPSYQGKVPFSYGGNGCNTSSFLTAINNAGNSSFWSAGHCGESAISYAYTTSPLNTWKHWVITIEGSTQRIYIDGELKETADNYIGPAYVEGKSGLIGALINVDGIGVYVDPSAGYFKGKIDDIRIYNHAITDQEVVLLFNDSTTYTPPNLQDGLSLFLPFNGNAYDESGNNNSGVVTGANTTQDRFGTDGRAYNFDGVDDYITIADNPNLFSDKMTISWWYNMSEYDNSGAVIGWVDGGNRYQQFFAGTTFSYFNGYSGSWFNPTYTLTNLNEWVHILVTYKKTGASSSTTSLFVNGELKQTDNNPMAMTYAPGINFFIGRNHSPGVEFKGKLDDFRIYNRVLETSEVLALYNDSTTYYPPIAEDSLVAYYAFNSTTNDSSGNGNNGINYNGVYSKDRYGFDNSSMYFNGVDSYVEGINSGNNLPVGNSPRSFSAWIKNYQYNQWGSNIFHYGTQQAAPTNFHFLITDVLGLGNGYGYGVVYGNTNLVDSTWHFVTGVYEGGTERTTKLYIDGKLDVTGVITTEPNTVLTNNWRVGRFMEGSSNFNGNIDELKIFNMALSDQKILEIYKIGTTAPDLLVPENNSTLNTLTPGFYWDSSVVATSYQIIISSDSTFTSIVLDETVIRMYYIISSGLLNTDVNYYWKVRTINDGGIGPWSDVFNFKIVITDVEGEDQIPTEFALMQNYPNPFNPSTSIKYAISSRQFVQLKVYDVLGNEIATLVNEEKPAGVFEVQFNVTQDSRPAMSSGVYFYKLTAGDFVSTKKMILIK